MPKYMMEIEYSASGASGLLQKGGSPRVEVARKAAEGVGGRLEHFFFAFGDTDAYLICEFPDDAAAAATALTVSSGGGATAKIVRLLEASVIDKASDLTVPYRLPGT